MSTYSYYGSNWNDDIDSYDLSSSYPWYTSFRIYGQGGNDTLAARIFGRTGTDELWGGYGDDTFSVSSYATNWAWASVLGNYGSDHVYIFANIGNSHPVVDRYTYGGATTFRLYSDSDGSPLNVVVYDSVERITFWTGANTTAIYLTEDLANGRVRRVSAYEANIRTKGSNSDWKAYNLDTYTAYINSLNSAPTNIYISSSSFDENIPNGSIVATLTAIDSDTSDTHTYSLVNGYTDSIDNSYFTISGNKLKLKASPDFETKNSYTIALKATDNHGNSTDVLGYTFKVNDLNEVIGSPPTAIYFSPKISTTEWIKDFTWSFNENIPAGSIIGKFAVDDPDKNDTHQYFFVDSDNNSDNNLFTIEDDLLKINSTPDFETKNKYTVYLVAEDNNKNQTENTYFFNFEVNDLANEWDKEAPIITGPNNAKSPLGSVTWIDENKKFVHKFIADEEVTWSMTEKYQANSYFNIDPNSGDLQFNNAPNYENPFGYTGGELRDNNGYYIEIQAKDIAENIATQTVWVNVRDVIESNKYAGKSYDYTFINQGNGKYGIKKDDSSQIDPITGLSLIEFSDKSIDIEKDVIGTFDQVTGLNTDSGKMFRLYNAAFARFPDADGLKYWIEEYSSGRNSERVVAQSFLASAEFKDRYGLNVSNAKYVETLYVNVLGRDYDQSGYSYWLGQLNSGNETRHELLLGFAESAENQTLFTEITGLG